MSEAREAHAARPLRMFGGVHADDEVNRRAREALDKAGLTARADVVANTDYVGKGYGIPAASTIEAIRMFAELEGILLDPVYSGKGAAGLIDLIRKGHFKKGERIVFIHTGGSTALFGYLPAFDAMAHAADQATA